MKEQIEKTLASRANDIQALSDRLAGLRNVRQNIAQSPAAAFVSNLPSLYGLNQTYLEKLVVAGTERAIAQEIESVLDLIREIALAMGQLAAEPEGPPEQKHGEETTE